MVSVEFVAAKFIILWTLSVAWASIQTTQTTYTKGKMVATSHTTIQPISKIQCVERCNEESKRNRCSIAGYDKSLKACYLSVDNQTDVVNVANENVGVFFFQQSRCMNKPVVLSITFWNTKYTIIFETLLPDSKLCANQERLAKSGNNLYFKWHCILLIE